MAVPVIHMETIVGGRGVSISIWPLIDHVKKCQSCHRGGERIDKDAYRPHLKRSSRAIPVIGSSLYVLDWQTLPSPNRCICFAREITRLRRYIQRRKV